MLVKGTASVKNKIKNTIVLCVSVYNYTMFNPKQLKVLIIQYEKLESSLIHYTSQSSHTAQITTITFELLSLIKQNVPKTKTKTWPFQDGFSVQ